MAATTPTTGSDPVSSNGIAIGMVAVRIAVDDANAEVTPTMTHRTSATSNGAPRPTAPWATQSMVPECSSTPT